MQLTSFAPISNLLWKYLEHNGIDPAPIYKNAGIDLELLFNPNARLNVGSMDAVWADAVTLLDDPELRCKDGESTGTRL